MSPRLLRPVLAVAALAALAVSVSLTPAQATGRALHGPGHAAAAGTPQRPPRPAYVPRIKHVFVINIENKGYDETFGDGSAAPYLATTLRQKGVLLTEYHGTAHNSLPNYIAQISGQAPNPSTQLDCQTYSAFTAIGPNQSPQQKVGSGCVYPAGVRTLPWQLTHRDLTWRGYMQQMGTSCRHPKLGAVDQTQHATPGHNYAVRHNPFMYFASIVDRGRYCKHHVKDLSRLPQDLKRAGTTRNLTYITPDLCRDGHDDPCADKSAGGLPQVNDFLKKWVPQILQSPAYRRNGMLVITADESDSPVTDSSACCGETSGPNVAQAGITGPGGGLTGALVISRFTSKNSWSTTPYNHYSLLASLEEIFRLPKIGMAKVPTLPVFGLDVYNNGWWNP
jgi:hypothetical protein